MKKFFCTVLIILIAIAMISAQDNVTTKYYSDRYRNKEVSKEKAKFSETVIFHADGKITQYITNLGKNLIVNSHTYKGDEPFGIWKYTTGDGVKELNYDFELSYTKQDCSQNTLGKINYHVDQDSLHYKAPKLNTGDENFFKFLIKNIKYPDKAEHNEIEGRVVLTYKITTEGEIIDLSVKEGVNVLLDKEAFRVIKLLKYSSAPTLNGVPVEVCIVTPISFKLPK